MGISLIYPLFINEFSYLVAFMVILLSGVPGVLNYYFQGKFRVLLMAEGKSYIISNISTVISVLTSISKIILIKFGCNIIHLQMVYCIISIFQVFIYEYLFKKSYKWVKYTAKPDYLAIKQKNSVLIHQISNLILTNTDVFILTIATNLKVVSVYTVYNMVFDMINTSVQTVGNSVSYIFGESFYTNRKKFKKIFDVYEVYFFNFTFSLYTITLLLIIPFLRLYTNGVSDINYIDFYLPILFTLMKLLACSRTPALNIINVVGLFKETQNSAIIEAIINLSVSIFAVYNWGIYGVIIGTIIALLYRAIYIVLFASKNILARSAFKTFIRWGINILIFCCIIFIEKKISRIEIFGYKDFLFMQLFIV